MDRRQLLKAGGFGALGLYMGGCAPRVQTIGPARRVGPLTPVRVSWNDVIRTTVGLRPYRRSGFVVRAERIDDKTLIHNYGHGGAGHSLSWGTGFLATELALDNEQRRAAVVGAGVVGLTTARQLQRHGFTVTIYATSVPPHTTSNKAWASFTPASGIVALGARSPAWDTQFRRAARISYEQLQLLAGRDYGVSWIYSYSFSNAPPVEGRSPQRDTDSLVPPDIRPGLTVYGPGEHPFPAPYAIERAILRIEPSIYLDALMHDFMQFDGRVVIRSFETVSDLVTLEEPLIVNCTGLGTRDLFGDEALIPVKGQLTFLVPQPFVSYATFGGVPDSASEERSFGIHMMPRRDGIALGGTSERDVWDLEPNDDARREIVRGHMELFGAMRGR